MANIKISELNELTKSQRAYDDYLAIVDSSANETKKISLENIMQNNIQLLAVTDTAPSECNIGDKYYNTETGLIYTAIEEDTWGTVGEEPIEDILYVVFSEKNTYAWNGTDMLSVGGGSGSEIVIGDESEATEDTKLLVDTSGSTDELKYKDETTGTFKDLEVKALDSMPVGTIVDYDGQASDIPVGWEEVDNVLWTNPNPTSSFASQSIVLSSGDYNYLEIYFKTYIDQDNVKSVKVEKGQNAVLDCAFYYSSKNYMGTRQITYTDATHLSIGEGRAIIQDDVLNNGVTSEWIIPIKIIGYK